MEDEKEVSGRIISSQFAEPLNILNNELGDDLYLGYGKSIRVYKFRQVSGYSIFTKNGEIPKFQNINKSEQFANFKTGKEPITIVWEGSSNLSNSQEKPNTNHFNFKVGNYEECFSIGDYSNSIETNEMEVFGANFIVDTKNADLELESKSWIPTTEDQLNYFYVVVDKRYPSYQLLQLKEYKLFYNETNGNFFKSTLSFENINLKYAASGRQILDFVQFGSIGFAYAFPKEIENEDGEIEVILDDIKLESIGVHSIQIDTNTTSGLCTPIVYGSPLNNFENIVEPTQRLFLLDSILPETSGLFYNDQQMNYFAIENGTPTYKLYIETYTKNPQNPMTNLGSYNVGSEKKFQGGININDAKAKATNPINTKTNKYSNSINNNDAWIIIDDKYKISKYINGMKDLTTRIVMKTTDFFNFNSYILFYTDQFTFEEKEIIKYKLTDVFGVLGGLINIIVGGFDVGWTNDKTLNLAQPLNFIMPTSSYEMGTAVSVPTGGKVMMPLEIFSDDKEGSIYPIDNKQLCSYHFTLTDYILDTSAIIVDAEIGKGGDGIWNTKYIAQKLDENFKPLLASGEPFAFNPATTKAIPNPFNENQKYIVDAIDLKSIYSGDVRISAFVRELNPFDNKQFNRSVYSSIFSTNSKITKKFRIISTFINFSYWSEFNTIGSFPNTWPELIFPPSPTPIGEVINIDSIKPFSPLFESQSISSNINIYDGFKLNVIQQVSRYLYLFSDKYRSPEFPNGRITISNSFIDNTTMSVLSIMQRNDDTKSYDELNKVSGKIYSSPNILNANNNHEIFLNKYSDGDLLKFNRIAIQIVNEFGVEVWIRIPNIDFVLLKNNVGTTYNAPVIRANKVFKLDFFIAPYEINDGTKNYELGTKFLKGAEIQRLTSVRKYEKFADKVNVSVVAGLNGFAKLKLNSYIQEMVSFNFTGVDSYEPRKVVKKSNFSVDNEYKLSKQTRDYSSNNSLLKIIKVLILSKDYDESSIITYIN